jgi:hypothetical protein
LPNRAFGTLHDPLPLPAYRGDRLAFAPHTAAASGLLYLSHPAVILVVVTALDQFSGWLRRRLA